MLANWEGLEEAVAVAEVGTFVGAANRLGVSTSHVSRVISRLETKLGARLFTRTTRKVNVTAAGRDFVERCQSIIHSRDEILAYAGGSIEPQGQLRISCSVALGERFIAPILMRYRARYPQVGIELDLNNRVVDVVVEEFDLAVRTRHIAEPRLVAEQIAVRPLIVCAAPSYIEEHGKPNVPADLPSHSCLIGTATTWPFRSGEHPAIVTPTGRWHCNSGNVIVEAALQGLGICQLPEFYVKDHIVAGRLVPLLEKFAGPPEPVWAVYAQKRALQPKVKSLVELLRSDLAGELCG